MYLKHIHQLIWVVLTLIVVNNLNRGQSVSYTVSAYDYDSKLFNVKCEIQNLNQDKLQLDWPVWTPGYVVLWNYGQYVSNLKATDQNDSPLTVRRVSDSRAFIECNDAQLIIFNYQVLAVDPPDNLGFAQAYLDSIQGWYNGAAMFPEINGLRDLPVAVRFDLPKGWELATGMKSNVEGNGFIVQNFDELVDSPVQIGHFLSCEFLSNGVQFKAVVAGCDSVDMSGLETMLKKIVDEEFVLMKNVPIDRYLFIYHVANRGAGGLEHLNATTISLRTEEYFKKDSWLKVVTAHEFFHVWNAKRIRTRTFDRYDYSRPHRTQTVWFAEGITAYYTDLILHRCGLFTKEDVYTSLAGILNLYENNPARKRLSWEDISWYIWEPEIRQGLEVWLLPGWMIDLKIRDATDNVFSLDDVMRFMNLWNGESKIGFEEEDLPRIISAVTQQDFSDFFRRHISGCEPFPYNDLFAAAGLEWDVSTEIVPSLGYRFGRMVDKRVKVIDLDEDQDVQDNGLQINDIILEINGYTRPTFNELQSILRELKPGSEVAVLIEREGVKLLKTIKVTSRELIRSKIQEIPNPTPRQLSIRRGILNGIVQR
jgi:predicted metalloprotease with PDZ domain